MTKYKILLKDLSTQEVTGKKFSYMVSGEKFWFIVHPVVNSSFYLQVTHYPSGKAVAQVPRLVREASRGGNVAAGKRTLELLIESVGEQNARSVLAGA